MLLERCMETCRGKRRSKNAHCSLNKSAFRRSAANKRFFIAAIVERLPLDTTRESMREGNIADAIKKGSVAFRKDV